MALSNLKIAATALVVSVAFSAPALSHDCEKKREKADKKTEHMMMKHGEGHMDRMHMHKKMMTKMKACMAEKMEQDKVQDPEQLRHNMMGHMEMCMASMKPSGEAPEGKAEHEHGDKKADKKHKH